MARYSYSRRPIGTCRAQAPTRASETAQTVENLIALYSRPRLVHSGPAPWRRGETEAADPHPWSWSRMDLVSGDKATVLDRCSLWLSRVNGTLDVSLRICPVTYVLSEEFDDPSQYPTVFSADFKVELLQYQSSTTIPTVLASSTTTVSTLAAYPAQRRPVYPILTQIREGWRRGSGDYDVDDHQIRAGLRTGQLYRQDLGLLQSVRLRLDYGEPWSPNFTAVRTNACLVRVSCYLTPSSSISWDPAIRSPYNAADSLRVYCVASEIRDAGRIV